jgi:hypothetical protein
VPTVFSTADVCFLGSLTYIKLTTVPYSYPSHSRVVQPQHGRHSQEEKFQIQSANNNKNSRKAEEAPRLLILTMILTEEQVLPFLAS